MTDLQKTDTGVQSVARQKLNKKESITLKSLNLVVQQNKGTILLADISGSMSGEKMQGLKDALSTVWKPGIQGIAFNHELYELMEQDIQFLDASGTTEMLDALQEAWSRNPSHMILLTDGQPNNGTKEVLQEVSHHTDTPIDTVGIGKHGGYGYDADFLREIARLTGGRFTDVGEPMKLTETLQFLLDYTPDSIQAPQEGVIQL